MPNKPIKIRVKKLHVDAIIPTQAHSTDAGIDLYSVESVRISSHSHKAVGTGIALKMPDDYYAQIAERSGVSLNTPLSVKAGIIDPGYTGEIKMIIRNDSSYPHDIDKGTKLTQLTFHKRYNVELEEVDSLEDTDRGEKGFGSSD